MQKQLGRVKDMWSRSEEEKGPVFNSFRKLKPRNKEETTCIRPCG
jgi:hypothetical protein